MRFAYLLANPRRGDLFAVLVDVKDLELVPKSSYLSGMTHEDNMNWAFPLWPSDDNVWGSRGIFRFDRLVKG